MENRKVSKSLYQIDGKDVRVISKMDVVLQDALPKGNYIVKQNPMSGEYYLTHVDEFVMPSKFYGDVEAQAKRILNTFADRPGTTGVLLSGLKGAGKSLLAKVISAKASLQGMPTILVNAPLCGDAFNSFIQSIDQPAVVMFDEFEKVYKFSASDEPDDSDMSVPGSSKNGNGTQSQLLTLLDGTFPTKKLFLLTANNRWRISSNMMNRPGRIYYFLEFEGLDEAFVRDYCKDNLKNQNYVKHMVQLGRALKDFNFDQLQAVVEEVNRYGETPQEALKMLNVKPLDQTRSYTVSATHKGKKVALHPNTQKYSGDPFINTIYVAVVSGRKDEAGDDVDIVQLYVEPDDMLSYNAIAGVVKLQKDGYEVTLTEKPNTERNWLSFMDR